MKTLRTALAASLVLLPLAAAPLRAGDRELRTVESAAEVVQALRAILLKGIPQSLLDDAAGVAVIPHVIKAGLVIDGRFGRGVVLARQPGGAWSNPVFVTLEGGGVGGQLGFESTDVVLVFKTRKSLDRALEGKLTLGGDAAVAAGPVGREAEAATNRPLPLVDIYSYSRSRGLFAGVSVEGSHLRVDGDADEAFYRIRGCRPADVLGLPGPLAVAAVTRLQAELGGLATPPPPPPAVILVPQPPPPVVPAPPAPLPPEHR